MKFKSSIWRSIFIIKRSSTLIGYLHAERWHRKIQPAFVCRNEVIMFQSEQKTWYVRYRHCRPEHIVASRQSPGLPGRWWCVVWWHAQRKGHKLCVQPRASEKLNPEPCVRKHIRLITCLSLNSLLGGYQVWIFLLLLGGLLLLFLWFPTSNWSPFGVISHSLKN